MCMALSAIRGRLHLAIYVGGRRKGDVPGKGWVARAGRSLDLESHE